MKKYYPKPENLVYQKSHFSPPNSLITAGIMVPPFAACTTQAVGPRKQHGGSMVCSVSNTIILQGLQEYPDSFSAQTLHIRTFP